MKKLKLFALAAVALMGLSGAANAETAIWLLTTSLGSHSGLYQW